MHPRLPRWESHHKSWQLKLQRWTESTHCSYARSRVQFVPQIRWKPTASTWSPLCPRLGAWRKLLCLNSPVCRRLSWKIILSRCPRRRSWWRDKIPLAKCEMVCREQPKLLGEWLVSRGAVHEQRWREHISLRVAGIRWRRRCFL